MRITLKQAREFLAPFVGSGLVPTNPKVVEAINEATMRLLPKMPAEGTIARFRFCISNGTITMPREIQTLLAVNVDATPVSIFSRWYEFLNYGPGTMDDNQSGSQDFIDLGDGFATHTDINTARPILVVAGAEEQDKTIRIMGNDENGLEVRSDDGPGEVVKINKLFPIYTTHKFSAITSVVKPVTKGYVYLSAYEPEVLARYALAIYHPDETNPSYRRYRVTGVSTENVPITVTALVKLGYIPLSYDTDVLLIQNLAALKIMLQAIRRLDAGDFPTGKAFETSAKQTLQEQVDDIQPQNNQINIETAMPGAGMRGVM